MNIKCNAIQCKFNKETKCTLDSIEINFCNDEYRYADCSNFEESKEYLQQHYKIMPISIIPGYKYIIFSTTYESVVNYLELSIDDIKLQYNETGKFNILIDNLLSNGANAYNRYIEFTINLNKNNAIEESYEAFKIHVTPKNSELRKFSAEFYKNYPETIKYSILNSVQKKMILKGIGI